MSEDTKQDIIEDVTEEAILEDQELEQDTSAEEVTETQDKDLSDTIMSVLLGEKKHAKKEAEHDDEEDEEDEVEESTEVSEDDAVAEAKKVSEEEDEEEEEEEEVKEAKSKKEVYHDEDDDSDEEEDEDEVEEAVAPKGGDVKQAKVPTDEEEVAKAAASDAAKGVKAAGTPTAKGDASKADVTDDEEESVKDADKASKTKLAKEDLDILISAEANLTEEFKSKASTLFEAAVADKVITERKRMQEEFDTNLQEEVSQVRDTLVERIDDYLGYVVESWIEDNQVAVDTKLRTDIAEGFMGSLKSLFTESYIEVPESKVDLFDELSEEVDTVKESLEASNKEKAELAEQVETLIRAKVIAEASTDLASTQASKLTELTEEIEYVSEEVFADKVKTIKESLFSTIEESQEEKSEGSTETIIEGASEDANVSNSMKAYLKTLSNK